MLLDPCHMQNMVALPSSQLYFKLHCILHTINTMNESQVYKRELFGNKECGYGCCSTQIDSLGDVLDCHGGECKLYNNANAQNTIDAILSSKHCKCKVSSPFFSFGCDCSVWSALHKHRWENVDVELYQRLNAQLKKCSESAAKLTKTLKTIKNITETELYLVCKNITYSNDVLTKCTKKLFNSEVTAVSYTKST